MPSYHYEAPRLTESELTEALAHVPHKLQWFMDKGYEPHYFQLIFHSMWNEPEHRLCRYRHLVAGRRGGKTLSAAWEVVYYALHPEFFHWDAHSEKSDKPLHIWVLTPDLSSAGRAAMYTMREVFRLCGMVAGKDYKENRTEKTVEFPNGTILEYKTAERAEKLVGMGVDLLWMDEAAVIPTDEAWNIARPTLSDKEGIVIGTTTPRGKNWYYEKFWGEKADLDPDISKVEYRSIDNPYFKKREWESEQRNYHPLMFKREYMASFDATAGVELSGDWLHYYETDNLPRKTDSEELDLRTYIGVDPAVSLSDEADRFAMALIGVDKRGFTYILDIYADKIQFPEQIEKIMDWNYKYRPMFIGVESNAYQAALGQQLQRLEGQPPIFPVYAQGKKKERIMAMAPLFRMARIKLKKTHTEFIDEWINYDSTAKNPKDDCLDSVEIALRAAGSLLPEAPMASDFEDKLPEGSDLDKLAWRTFDQGVKRFSPVDSDFGDDW